MQFSEVIPRLTPEEEKWLREQLEVVSIFAGQEYPESEVPGDKDSAEAQFRGCQAFRDLEDYGGDMDFNYEFDTSEDEPEGWGRHLWLYAEESGDPEQVAHLVRKFLKAFRPAECWSLSYSTTCSKLRVGEFGGGALFVTAADIKWQTAYSFIADQRRAFKQAHA